MRPEKFTFLFKKHLCFGYCLIGGTNPILDQAGVLCSVSRGSASSRLRRIHGGDGGGHAQLPAAPGGPSQHPGPGRVQTTNYAAQSGNINL